MVCITVRYVLDLRFGGSGQIRDPPPPHLSPLPKIRKYSHIFAHTSHLFPISPLFTHFSLISGGVNKVEISVQFFL